MTDMKRYSVNVSDAGVADDKDSDEDEIVMM